MQVIKALHGLVTQDALNDSAKEVVSLMYHTALLTSGFDVDSPKKYASQVYGMMGMALTAGGTGADASHTEASADGATALEADQVIEEK